MTGDDIVKPASLADGSQIKTQNTWNGWERWSRGGVRNMKYYEDLAFGRHLM